MLRALLVAAIPFATLAASTAGIAPQSTRAGQLGLAEIPIARNLEKDPNSQLSRLRSAAEGGDLDSMAQIGVMYYWGQGAPMDWDQARVWLRKASERGHRDAQAKLGAMFFLGQGGPRDLDESLKWFRRAADQGEPYAQGCMGVMYAVGEGVPRDLLQAYVWLVQAQAGGDDDAAEPLQQVKSHLTPAQIQEGDRLATEAARARDEH
jgi:TPR repeat protein